MYIKIASDILNFNKRHKVKSVLLIVFILTYISRKVEKVVSDNILILKVSINFVIEQIENIFIEKYKTKLQNKQLKQNRTSFYVSWTKFIKASILKLFLLWMYQECKYTYSSLRGNIFQLKMKADSSTNSFQYLSEKQMLVRNTMFGMPGIIYIIKLQLVFSRFLLVLDDF